jgi:hypothetical protein
MSILAGRAGAIKFLLIFGALNHGMTYYSKVLAVVIIGFEKAGDDNTIISRFND